ncbi:hypothetical protein Cantr_09809 [Candida viswanathii]|uniref:Uncharacterized protein n=1 Tax=Candida viswanathii TaxID=5486 RepID=A0A367YBN5_9ASCO|nr:hypothetical protein Cantr_09809 [Candida viswanathii]
MADKIKEKNQYHLLKSKYSGVGDADTTSQEFLTTIHNDTISSLAHHQHLLLYNSIVTNEHPHQLKQQFIRKLE